MSKSEIILIGSGNLATHLGKAFYKQGYKIRQVFSRDIENAKLLAKNLKCQSYTDMIAEIDLTADIYILALSDDVIEQFAGKIILKGRDQIVLHTSGSVPMGGLKGSAKNYGVFYPLQSFTKRKKVDFKKIPICVEGNNKIASDILIAMAAELSSAVYEINSEQRQALHLAAIFANNFSNFMYQIAFEILESKNIPFDILRPLILETAKKVMDARPLEMQTGPAKRRDLSTIKKHLELLSTDKKYVDIYQLLSKAIMK